MRISHRCVLAYRSWLPTKRPLGLQLWRFDPPKSLVPMPNRRAQTSTITALDVSNDKRWAATVDAAAAVSDESGGGEGLLVVWDVGARAPVRSVAQPHRGGSVAVAFSADATRVATISAPFSDPTTGEAAVQEVAVWDWTSGSHDRPAALARVPAAAGVMVRVAFHPQDRAQLVTTGPERVIFWGVDPPSPEHAAAAAAGAVGSSSSGPGGGDGAESGGSAVGTISYFVPALAKGTGSLSGMLTGTAFLPHGTEAVTGTADGKLLVWTTPAAALADGKVLERAAAKMVQLVEEPEGAPGAAAGLPGISTVRCLAVGQASGPGAAQEAVRPDKRLAQDASAARELESSSAAVVVGFTDGAVRVYDGALRLLAWFEDLAAGPVSSVSFAAGRAVQQPGGAGPLLPDLVVGTTRALVVGLASSALSELDAESRRGTLLMQGFGSGVFGAAAHPTEPLVLAGTREGALSVWDVRSRELQLVRLLQEEAEEAEEARLRRGELPRPEGELFAEGAFAVTAAGWHPSGSVVAVAVGARALSGSGEGRPASRAEPPAPEPGREQQEFAGYIRLLDADSLEDVQAPLGGRRALRGGGLSPQASAQAAGVASLDGGPAGAVTVVKFSPDGQWLASADSAGLLCLWRRLRVSVRADEGRREWQLGAEEADDVHEEERWVYIGRARPHTGDIVGLDWTTDPTEGHSRLVTAGTDRRVCEADLQLSSVDAGVVIMQPRVRVEHTATPTACCWVHPRQAGSAMDAPAAAWGGAGASTAAAAAAGTVSTELLLATATDEMKLRLLSGGTKAGRRTVAAPEFTGPVAFLDILRSHSAADGHADAAGSVGVMVFGAAERSAGAVLLPLDGNPHAAAGVLAHPGQIAAVLPVVGDRVVTAGGDDGTLAVWRVHRGRLAEAKEAGGTDIEPFLETLPGGGAGDFYQELCDFFAYAQMRSQGENSTEPRRTGDTLPLSELPSLMRALGVFPTGQEAEALCTEVRFGDFGSRGETREHVDLAGAVRLFVNHRAAMGVGKGSLQEALEIIAARTHTGPDKPMSTVKWGFLRRLLQEKGEPMTPSELDKCLMTLTGKKNPLGQEEYVTADKLAFEVLGFVDPQSQDTG